MFKTLEDSSRHVYDFRIISDTTGGLFSLFKTHLKSFRTRSDWSRPFWGWLGTRPVRMLATPQSTTWLSESVIGVVPSRIFRVALSRVSRAAPSRTAAGRPRSRTRKEASARAWDDGLTCRSRTRGRRRFVGPISEYNFGVPSRGSLGCYLRRARRAARQRTFNRRS